MMVAITRNIHQWKLQQISYLKLLFIICIIAAWTQVYSVHHLLVNPFTPSSVHDESDLNDRILSSPSTVIATNIRSRKIRNWPGIPKEEIGHPLVKKGYIDFIENSRSLFLEHLDDFIKVYNERPDKVNMCGMRINHSYALYLAIKALKPTTIIESGVNAGHSTYMMRNAAPNARIYSIDPLEQPICGQKERWIDTSNNEYYTGNSFQDINDIDWDKKIQSGEIIPNQTLVFLDDHMDPSTRYATIIKYGFRHILLEDNYKQGCGSTTGDKAGWLPKQMFHRSKERNSEFFWSITSRYGEFPPLVPPNVATFKRTPKSGFLHESDDLRTIMAPLFRPDIDNDDKKIFENICNLLGINATLNDQDSYLQVMNYNQFAYLEIVPMAPELLKILESHNTHEKVNKNGDNAGHRDIGDWPGIPKEEIGHPLVQKGYIDFIENSRSLFLEHLDDFIKVYNERPDKVNMCGMRINHSYALYLAIKALKPTTIIESGVNAGHSTYMMRNAAPNARIYSIDPLEQPICGQKERWIDSSEKNEYFTGNTFQDINDIDWDKKIQSGEIIPNQTLVFLDDHMDPSTRYATIIKYGFRHILLEDNYKHGCGSTTGDKAGWLPKQMFHQKNNSDSEFFWSMTNRYGEFPPLVPPNVATFKRTPKSGFLHESDDLRTIMAPLFRPDINKDDKKIFENICNLIGINATLNDQDSYLQVMNYNQFAYLEFVPKVPRLMTLL